MSGKALLAISIVVMVVIGVVPVASFLQVTQPVFASIVIQPFGQESPTFNIIDNVSSATLAEEAAHFEDYDRLVIDLAGLKIGKAHKIQYGHATDPVFTLQNNYGQDMTLTLESRGKVPIGMTFDVYWLSGTEEVNIFQVSGNGMGESDSEAEVTYPSGAVTLPSGLDCPVWMVVETYGKDDFTGTVSLSWTLIATTF